MQRKQGLIRRVLDSLVVGRQRTAQRYVETYLRDHDITPRAEKS